MECSKIGVLAKKYELGELDYFEKRAFEKHVRSCDKCYKKYKALLLLGALLYASKKTYSPSKIELFFASSAVKIAAITAAVLIFTAAIHSFGAGFNSEQESAIKTTEIRNGRNIDENNSGKTENIKNSSTNKKHLKITSREDEKEIEIRINRSSMQIESRGEK